jgi:DNA replication protein DnaC
MNNLVENIKLLTKELKLPYITRNILEEIEEANSKKLSYSEFLEELLKNEHALRLENSKQNRIRIANFPYKKYIEDLERDFLPDDAKNKLEKLISLEFIKNKQNIIFVGNSGTGKSHLSIGLGIMACNTGYKVLFTKVPNLINKLKECRSQRTLLSTERQFEKYDLIILDELGYISFDKEGGELLFNHLSLRAERKSTIITSNLSFEKWRDIFHDPIMTTAIIDRLTHKSFIVNMNGNSYRLKETKEMIENFQTAHKEVKQNGV